MRIYNIYFDETPNPNIVYMGFEEGVELARIYGEEFRQFIKARGNTRLRSSGRGIVP